MEKAEDRETNTDLAMVEGPLEATEPERVDPEEFEFSPVSEPAVRQTSGSPLLWIVGGLLIGTAATLFFTRLAPKQTTQPTEYVVRPPITTQAPKQVAQNNVQGPPSPGKTNPDGTTPQPGGVAPVNPLGLGLAIPSEMNKGGKLNGTIFPRAAYENPGPTTGQPPKQGTAVAPVKGSTPQPDKHEDPATAAKGSVQLLTISARVANPSDAKISLASWARQAGGSAQTFKGYDDKSENTTEGVIVFVPEAKLQDFIAFARTLGVGPVDETWVGTPGDRRSKLAGSAQSQLDALRKRKDELLVQYYDDAPQVKHASEGIDVLTANMANLRPPKSADGLEAVKVVLMER